ncbi:MAG: hypothetical protein HC765_10560 [Brachymonas sp.]|nr:hypothetical protein [Brachymonas sp.]
MSGDAENGWQELWDSRAEALAKVFGKYDDTILHASVPFEMGQDVGGSPDVLSFPHHTDGVLYVTADLIGSDQRPNSEGQYELAVVHSAGDDWGISIIAICLTTQ